MFQKHILQVAYTLIYSWNGCPFTLVMTVSLSHFDHCWIHRYVVAGKSTLTGAMHSHGVTMIHSHQFQRRRTALLSIGHCYITVLFVVYLLLYSCLLADRSPDTCDSWSYYDHFWYMIITTMIIIVHCHITALFAIFLFLCSPDFSYINAYDTNYPELINW